MKVSKSKRCAYYCKHALIGSVAYGVKCDYGITEFKSICRDPWGTILYESGEE